MFRLGDFIVDGVACPDVPSGVTLMMSQDFGVRESTFRSINGQRLNVIASANIDEAKPRLYKRKVHRQAWKMEWNGQEAVITDPLTFLLRDLYETQRVFWLQFDDEMSRGWGKLLSVGFDLLNPNVDHSFFTPTFPVFPGGHEPGDDESDFTGMLMVGNEIWTDPFTVDNELGHVLIAATDAVFNHRTKVYLKYTWRVPVRIQMLDIAPAQLAQTYYAGDVVFEQVPFDEAPVLAWRDPPRVYSPIPDTGALSAIGSLAAVGYLAAGAKHFATAIGGLSVNGYASFVKPKPADAPAQISFNGYASTPTLVEYSDGADTMQMVGYANTPSTAKNADAIDTMTVNGYAN